MSFSDVPKQRSGLSPDPNHGAGGSKPRAKGVLEKGLYVTGVPIGHAKDITVRALEVLAGADAIAAEDTRVTGKLLNLHGISGKLVSYREENAARAIPAILARLARGEAVALVSDAGTPHVSDPGGSLVKAAAEAGHNVVAVPGPSALTAAVSISGLSAKRTLFAGFLPAQASARRAEIMALKPLDAALVFFEAPHRIAESLADLAAILGPRDAVICRELTKRYEETRRAPLNELAVLAAQDADLQRGEIVIVIAPGAPEATDDAAALDAALTKALATMRVKDAADAVAGALNLPRRTVYARALELKGG